MRNVRPPTRGNDHPTTDKQPVDRYPAKRRSSSPEIVEVLRIRRKIRRPVLIDPAEVLQQVVSREFGLRLFLGRSLLNNEPQPLFDEVFELAPAQCSLGFRAAEQLVGNVDRRSHAM